MNAVGAFDAKTHLSQLLERVMKGERFIITRHGTPVALLIPFASAEKKPLSHVIEDFRELQNRHNLGGVSLKDLIQEGRK